MRLRKNNMTPLAIVLAVGMVAAASAPGGASASTEARPPIVSEPFPVADPVFGPAVGYQDTPAVAWSGSLYFQVWSDGRCSCLVGTRISADGSVLDPIGLFLTPYLAQGFQVPSIAWIGTSFLVIHEVAGPQQETDLYGFRVAEDGTLLDLEEFPVANGPGSQYASSIAWDGSRALVTWLFCEAGCPGAAGVSVTFVEHDGTVEDTVGFPIETSAYFQKPGVAWDGTNYTITWVRWEGIRTNLYAGRVSPDGTLLDRGIPVSVGPGDPTGPRIAWIGSMYVIAWGDDRDDPSDVFMSRVLTDGTVLDPGGIPVEQAPGEQSGATVAQLGPNALVAWTEHESGEILGVRLSPDGQFLDPDPISIASGQNDPLWDLTSAGRVAMAVWVRMGDIEAVRLATDGSVLDPDPIVTPFSANAVGVQAAATDGAEVLVIGGDTRRGRTATTAARVDGSGEHLDGTGTLLGGVGAVEAAWNGEMYLDVYWSYGRYNTANIRAARVAADAQLIDVGGFPVANGAYPQRNPAVASDGNEWLVVYEDRRTGQADISAALVSADGLVEKSRIVVSSVQGNQEVPRVTWDGENYLVAWEDMRGSGTDVYAARVTADGAVLDPAGIKVGDAEGGSFPRLVGGNGLSMVVWETSNTVRAARLDQDGTVLDPGGFRLASDTDLSRPQVAWDGRAFLVAWEQGPYPQRDVVGLRVSVDGRILDHVLLALAVTAADEGGHFLVAGPGAGRISLVYSAFSYELGAYRAFVAFIDEP